MEGRLQPVYTEPHSPGLCWADTLHWVRRVHRMPNPVWPLAVHSGNCINDSSHYGR